MQSEFTFWFSIWSLVAAVIVTLVLCITVINYNTTLRISQAINNGIDPLSAKCALDIPYDDGKLLCANLKE
jgi:putative effector of murein hydrolase